MSRLNHKHFALLAAVLATLFLLGGCLVDKEKAAAKRQEKLLREVAAIQDELVLTGDASVAILKLEALNEKHPDQVSVVEALGGAYREKDDALMTAFYYDYAFGLAPERGELALQSARAHEKNGSTAEALSAYRAYLELEPAASGLWRNIALLEMAEGNYQLALSAYLEALGKDKIQPDAQDRLNIGILYHRLGNQPQAQRWYEDLLAERKLEPPLRVAGMIGLFDLALRQKQWDRALELMHEIERFSPGALQEGDYASAYTELSLWDKRRKEAEAAALAKAEKERAQAEAEITQTEKNPGAQMTAGKDSAAQMETDKNSPAQAEAETDSAAQAGRKPTAQAEAPAAGVDAAALSAEVQAAQGNTPSAQDTGKRPSALGADNTSADALDSKSGAIENNAQTRAPAPPAKAVDVVDTDLAAKTTAGKERSAQTNELAPAAPATDAAKGQNRAEAKSLPVDTTEAQLAAVELAAAQSTAVQPTAAQLADEAEAAAQNASAAELAQRGQEAFEAGDYAAAAQLLEQSAKLNPNNGEVLDRLSRASFRIGQYPQAERYAMLATYAEPKNVNYRLEYLRAYQHNHPPASMLQQLISAKEAFPDDPNVTLALARGYEHLVQRKAQAAALYHAYLQMAPESEFADAIQQKLLEWEM